MNKNLVISNLLKGKCASFASFEYRNKQNELSRYNVVLRFNTTNLYRKSLSKVKTLPLQSEIERIAAGEVIESLEKSISAFSQGAVNEDYTRKNTETTIGNGLSIDDKGALHIKGLLVRKTVLEAGEPHKKVNSSEKTLAKNRIKKQLGVSKLREFCLNDISQARLEGKTLVF